MKWGTQTTNISLALEDNGYHLKKLYKHFEINDKIFFCFSDMPVHVSITHNKTFSRDRLISLTTYLSATYILLTETRPIPKNVLKHLVLIDILESMHFQLSISSNLKITRKNQSTLLIMPLRTKRPSNYHSIPRRALITLQFKTSNNTIIQESIIK